QLCGRDLHVVDISVVLVDVRNRQLHGFYRHVDGFHIIDGMVAHTELVQHSQSHQGGDALPIWGNLMDYGLMEPLGNRAAPVNLMRCQVLFIKDSTMLARMCRNPARDVAAVERFTMSIGDRLQSIRMAIATENLAGAGSASAGQETFCEARLIPQLFATQFPQPCDDGAHRKTIPSIPDGGLS